MRHCQELSNRSTASLLTWNEQPEEFILDDVVEECVEGIGHCNIGGVVWKRER
jgi:hypothetical protein